MTPEAAIELEQSMRIAESLWRSLRDSDIDAPGVMMILAALLGNILREHVPEDTRFEALELVAEEIADRMMTQRPAGSLH